MKKGTIQRLATGILAAAMIFTIMPLTSAKADTLITGGTSVAEAPEVKLNDYFETMIDHDHQDEYYKFTTPDRDDSTYTVTIEYVGGNTTVYDLGIQIVDSDNQSLGSFHRCASDYTGAFYGNFTLRGDTSYFINIYPIYSSISLGDTSNISVGLFENISHPYTPSFRNVSGKKGAITASWSDLSNATGYQVRYRKKGSTKWATKTVSENTITIKKLKRKKQYEIRVKALRVVNKKHYDSAWSAVYKVKTK